MEIVIVETETSGAEVLTGIVRRLLGSKPACVLGLATGTSPRSSYRLILDARRRGELSFAKAHAVLLDEYVGIGPDHSSSYRRTIRTELTDSLDLPSANLHSPDGTAPDLLAECARYEATLARLGGVDVQILGIGTDGHIGFNEPSSSLRSRTRLKTLTKQTRADNARFFSDADEVPNHVITQGIGTILDARHVVLLAWGESKALPVGRAVEGPVTAMCPASALQLHPHVTVVVDLAAAAHLELADYYREIAADKPVWQQH